MIKHLRYLTLEIVMSVSVIIFGMVAACILNVYASETYWILLISIVSIINVMMIGEFYHRKKKNVIIKDKSRIQYGIHDRVI